LTTSLFYKLQLSQRQCLALTPKTGFDFDFFY
jgi:hypothetical protein